MVAPDKASHYCACLPGFQSDGADNCLDIDECATGNPCGADKCLNKDGTYECMNAQDFSDYICGLLGPNPCGSEDPMVTCIGQGNLESLRQGFLLLVRNFHFLYSTFVGFIHKLE